jgi:hypothetical protein
MKLCFEKIKEITEGAVRMAEDADGIRFYRFTEEEEAYYKRTSEDFYKKTFSTAGVKLSFITDSEWMRISVSTEKSSSRTYFSLDVFENGKMIGNIDNFSESEMTGYYAGYRGQLGDFSGEFTLSEGEKEITVYMPWSVAATLSSLSLSNGANVVAKRSDKRIITYGDSITHGYDATRPSGRYASKLAEYLSAEEICKAIGGDMFGKKLVAAADTSLSPDYISVAYGTNDWNRLERDECVKNCQAFYKILSEKYPFAKIFALTPIWRRDLDEERKFGSFYDIEPMIFNAVEALPNVHPISCFDFVPHNENMFADLRLHPNDEGFCHYFSGIKEHIEKSF